MESHSQWVYESLTFFQLITGVASTVGVIHPFLESMGVRHFIYSRKGFLERLFKLSGKGALWIFFTSCTHAVHEYKCAWQARPLRRGWGCLGWPCLEKKRLRGDLTALCNLLRRCWPLVTDVRMCGAGQSCAREVQTVHQEKCTRKVVKHWDWLPGEVVVDSALKSML